MLESILAWYLAMQFLALVGLPLAFTTLKYLPSRGYGIAKALGLLLTGIVLWWGSVLHLWQNSLSAVLTAAGVVLLTGLLLLRRRWRNKRAWDILTTWWHAHRRYALITEALFLIAFVAWALVRASQPQLQTAGGEKWMEIAFLNAVLRSGTLPPHDPWLSGFAISYYYLGYVLLALLTRLTAIAPTIAFNLANAGWFALSAVLAHTLIYDMSRGRGAGRALLGPLMLLATGNGEGLLEVFHARGLFPARFWVWMDIGRLAEPPQPPYSWIPDRFFWWWQASRTLRDRTPWGDAQEVIDEFPAFSFTLGDMHPHLLGLPFVLVAVALALNAYLRATSDTTVADGEGGVRGTVTSNEMTLGERLLGFWQQFRLRLVPLTGYALILGALGFLNTWDFPIYWAVLVGAWVLGRYRRYERSFSGFFTTIWHVLPEAGVLGVLSILLYLPFWFALRSQAGGILPNLFNATRLHQFIVMFLPLLVPLGGIVIGAARRRGLRWLPAVGLGIGLMVGIALVGLIIGSAAAAPYLRAILIGESIQGYSLAPETAWAALRRRLLNPWTGLMLAAGVGIVLTALVQPPKATRVDRPRPTGAAQHGREDVFPLLLALVGLLLTLAPEFVYLKDVFVTRMNTIFKFYFQAWVLWSLAGAWQVGRWLGGSTSSTVRTPAATVRVWAITGRRGPPTAHNQTAARAGSTVSTPAATAQVGAVTESRGPTTTVGTPAATDEQPAVTNVGAWERHGRTPGAADGRPGATANLLAAGVALLLIAAGLLYTVLAVPARAKEQGVPWTLDGAAWLRESYPADAAAIAWLNANVKGAPVIVEAPGDRHRAYVYEGRVSALTGLPTLLGWGGHQLQWRGNYDEPAVREADIERLMTTTDVAKAAEILAAYDVRYVYVGPLERQRYPAEGLAKFEGMLTAVYDREGVTIYAVGD